MEDQTENLIRIEERLIALTALVEAHITESKSSEAEVWKEIGNLRGEMQKLELIVRDNSTAAKIGRAILWLFAVSGATLVFDAFKDVIK